RAAPAGGIPGRGVGRLRGCRRPARGALRGPAPPLARGDRRRELVPAAGGRPAPGRPLAPGTVPERPRARPGPRPPRPRARPTDRGPARAARLAGKGERKPSPRTLPPSPSPLWPFAVPPSAYGDGGGVRLGPAVALGVALAVAPGVGLGPALGVAPVP